MGQKDRSISGVILILLFCIFFVIDITLYIKKDLEHKKYEEKQEQLAVDRQHRAEVQKKYEIAHSQISNGIIRKKMIENGYYYLVIKYKNKVKRFEVTKEQYMKYMKNEKVESTYYQDSLLKIK